VGVGDLLLAVTPVAPLDVGDNAVEAEQLAGVPGVTVSMLIARTAGS